MGRVRRTAVRGPQWSMMPSHTKPGLSLSHTMHDLRHGIIKTRGSLNLCPPLPQQ